MKKTHIVMIAISLFLIATTSVPVSANEIILAGTLTHEHTEEVGNCYTPIYHVHSGTAGQATSNGCYTVASTTSGTCSPSKGGALSPTSWSCGGCGKTVTYQGWYVSGSCGQNHGTVYKTSSSCTCTASNNREDSLPGTHTYSKTVYDLGCGMTTETIEEYTLNCSLDSCSYTVTKAETADGLLYQLSLSDADFASNCLWEYYESGSDTPVLSENEDFCLIGEELDSGDLTLTITDIKGKSYILETITISKMKLVVIKDNVTHEIKKMFFDGQEIKHIDYNGVRLF